MTDQLIEVNLYNLAKSNRADHIPKIGSIVAVIVLVMTSLWNAVINDLDGGMALLTGLGAGGLTFAAFLGLGYPIVRYQHRRTMLERLRVVLPLGVETTAQAMRRLKALQADLTVDPMYGRLYEFVQTVPAYAALCDSPEPPATARVQRAAAPTTAPPVPPGQLAQLGGIAAPPDASTAGGQAPDREPEPSADLTSPALPIEHGGRQRESQPASPDMTSPALPLDLPDRPED